MADGELVRIHVHFAGRGAENGERSPEEKRAGGGRERTPGFAKIHVFHARCSLAAVDSIEPHGKESLRLHVLAELVAHTEAELSANEAASYPRVAETCLLGLTLGAFDLSPP